MVLNSLTKLQKTGEGKFRAALPGPTRCNFQHVTFDSEENVIAVDSKGQGYLVQWIASAWWIKQIGPIGQATFIKVNPIRRSELMVGLDSGDIKLLDLCSLKGQFRTLQGHKEPPTHASFYKNFCLTTSRREAILWDVAAQKKVHRLRSGKTSIKKGLISSRGTIAILYETDAIQSWAFGDLSKENRVDLIPFGAHRVRDLVFTPDGARAIICARNKILIFNATTWEVEDSVDLGDVTSSPKRALAPCSQDLIVLFEDRKSRSLNLTTRAVTVISPENVRKILASPQGQWLITLTCEGHLCFIPGDLKKGDKKVEAPRKINCKFGKSPGDPLSHEVPEHLNCIRGEVREVLKLDKLRSILRAFGEFPERHRPVIWKNLLKIPENREAFVALGNGSLTGLTIGLEDRSRQVLLEVIVGRLVQFCPMLSQCQFLPEMVFPFAVIFRREPVVALEFILIILWNFCQRWFEYHPLPPINVLNIIENVLGEVDPGLLDFYCRKGVTASEYAWPLMRSLFSEVMEGPEWMVLWDHLVTLGRPTMLLFCVVAYSVCNRTVIFELMNRKEDFEVFFGTQGQISARKILRVAEDIERRVSERNHPKKYLRDYFKYLPATGPYPPFLIKEYPKFLIGNLENAKQLMEMKQEEVLLKEERRKLARELEEKRLREESENYLKEIHHRRLHEIHRCYSEELKLTKLNLITERQKLTELTSGNLSDSQNSTKQQQQKRYSRRASKNQKKTRRKSTSCEKLRKEVDELENEVQTFLQSFRSSK